jgi:hypothetical protein
MMTAAENDARLLAFLRGHGPGTVTVKYLAEATGLSRVTVRVSATALAVEGLVCLVPVCAETQYVIRHLHAEAGRCEEPLEAVIQEVHPDGQR